MVRDFSSKTSLPNYDSGDIWRRIDLCTDLMDGIRCYNG